jgi:hypothetical protein
MTTEQTPTFGPLVPVGRSIYEERGGGSIALLWVNRDEQRSDAYLRLFVAAPRLLKAAQNADRELALHAGLLRGEYGDSSTKEHLVALQELEALDKERRAAIAQALGQQPNQPTEGDASCAI